MSFLGCIVLWWLSGSFLLLLTCFIVGKNIIVKDLIFSAIFGFMGPVALLFVIEHSTCDWLNKRIL